MKTVKKTATVFWQTLLVLGLAASLWTGTGLLGCRATADSVKLLEGDFTAPELRVFSPESRNTVTLHFSKAVKVTAAEVLDEETETVAAEAVRVPGDDPAVAKMTLSADTVTGRRYWLNGIVTDMSGNTLDFSVAFTGYNDQVPRLLLSEVRSVNSTGSGGTPKPKTEYIEVYTLSSGNIAGVQIFNSADGADKTYEFPDCEVAAGEYIVVHYGKPAEFTADEVDEIGPLTGAMTTAATPNSSVGRDFYCIGDARRLSETDVIILRERSGGTIVDALLTAKNTVTAWDAKKHLSAAVEVAETGIWPDAAEVSSAIDSTKTTNTRTIGRQNIDDIVAVNGNAANAARKGKAAWLVTATSSASPGKANSSTPIPEDPSVRKAAGKK